jgi:hypothetical protein
VNEVVVIIGKVIVAEGQGLLIFITKGFDCFTNIPPVFLVPYKVTVKRPVSYTEVE